MTTQSSCGNLFNLPSLDQLSPDIGNVAETGSEEQDLEDDKCSICLLETKTDLTTLDTCSHSFCFLCITQWLRHNNTCPFCKGVVSFIKHFVQGEQAQRGVPKEEILRVSDLHVTVEYERLRAASQQVTLIEENMLMNNHLSRLKRKRDELRLKRTGVSIELEQITERINQIRQLKELAKTASRSEFVGNQLFRQLIYEDDLRWQAISRNAVRQSFTRRDEITFDKRQKLTDWLERELTVIFELQAYIKMRDENLSVLNTPPESLPILIVIQCNRYDINTPNFTNFLVRHGIERKFAEKLQDEFFEYASSNLPIEIHNANSTYIKPGTRHHLHSNRLVAGGADGLLDPPVIQLDSDNDDMNDDITDRAHHRRTATVRSRGRVNDDVVVINEPERNLNHDERLRQGSSRQPPLRGRSSRPIQAIDAFGEIIRPYQNQIVNSTHESEPPQRDESLPIPSSSTVNNYETSTGQQIGNTSNDNNLWPTNLTSSEFGLHYMNPIFSSSLYALPSSSGLHPQFASNNVPFGYPETEAITYSLPLPSSQHFISTTDESSPAQLNNNDDGSNVFNDEMIAEVEADDSSALEKAARAISIINRNLGFTGESNVSTNTNVEEEEERDERNVEERPNKRKNDLKHYQHRLKRSRRDLHDKKEMKKYQKFLISELYSIERMMRHKTPESEEDRDRSHDESDQDDRRYEEREDDNRRRYHVRDEDRRRRYDSHRRYNDRRSSSHGNSSRV